MLVLTHSRPDDLRHLRRCAFWLARQGAVDGKPLHWVVAAYDPSGETRGAIRANSPVYFWTFLSLRPVDPEWVDPGAGTLADGLTRPTTAGDLLTDEAVRLDEAAVCWLDPRAIPLPGCLSALSGAEPGSRAGGCVISPEDLPGIDPYASTLTQTVIVRAGRFPRSGGVAYHWVGHKPWNADRDAPGATCLLQSDEPAPFMTPPGDDLYWAVDGVETNLDRHPPARPEAGRA